MKTEPLVRLRHREGIAFVSLNRPERHNALVPGLLAALLQALAHPQTQGAAAVILRAEGRSFSTGGDLAGFRDHRQTIGSYAHALVGQLNEVILAIYTHPAPVVCAVQGQVTGGSLGLLLAADHVIMHRGVTITPWYSVVGFSPDGGWTALLPDIIGRRQTMHCLAGNTSFDSDTCLALGLAHQVVEDDCDGAALEWAARIAEKDAGSIRRTRRLINADSEDLRRRLEAERDNFVEQIQTQTALDGIDLFLRRREHV
jgi:2-(1,2-epoxy-1,2-dihydrophenyl)acetyl-CoA isomerase